MQNETATCLFVFCCFFCYNPLTHSHTQSHCCMHTPNNESEGQEHTSVANYVMVHNVKAHEKEDKTYLCQSVKVQQWYFGGVIETCSKRWFSHTSIKSKNHSEVVSYHVFVVTDRKNKSLLWITWDPILLHPLPPDHHLGNHDNNSMTLINMTCVFCNSSARAHWSNDTFIFHCAPVSDCVWMRVRALLGGCFGEEAKLHTVHINVSCSIGLKFFNRLTKIHCRN